MKQASLMSCLHKKTTHDQDRGEIVCVQCAEVLEQKMNGDGLEFSGDNFMESMRTGPKTTLAMHDRGLSTVMGKVNKDASGTPISYGMRSTVRRMRLWDSRSMIRTSSERNLRIALGEMGKLKEKMGLSDAIIERASVLYRKSSEAGLVRGRSVKSVVGACIYAACRDMDTQRTIIEISKHLLERRKVVARSYRTLFRELGLSTPMSDPIKSVIKFANNLKIPESAKREAISIFDALSEKKAVAGKKPDAVSAAVIYMACIRTNVKISQQKVSSVSGISAVTIRNRVNEFSKYVELI